MANFAYRTGIAEGGIFKVRPPGSKIDEDDKRTNADSGYVSPACSNTNVGCRFCQMETFNTNKGQLNEKKLFSILEWGSYAANRDYGMTHEQLLSIGIGNDEMKKKYELEKNGIHEN